MGGGDGMSELSLVAALSPSCPVAKETIPLSVLQAVRALDQELGGGTEREALHAVVDSLVEWFLLESKTPRSRDGAWVMYRGLVDVCCVLFPYQALLLWFGIENSNQTGSG